MKESKSSLFFQFGTLQRGIILSIKDEKKIFWQQKSNLKGKYKRRRQLTYGNSDFNFKFGHCLNPNVLTLVSTYTIYIAGLSQGWLYRHYDNNFLKFEEICFREQFGSILKMIIIIRRYQTRQRI